MCRADPEAIKLFRPGAQDELAEYQAPQGLEPTSVIVGIHEQVQMRSKLVVDVVVVALDRRILDRAVHSRDLSVGPKMIHLGKPILDVVLVAYAVDDVQAIVDVLPA